MNPLQILMDEHRRIERVLDVLLGYADTLSRGETAPTADLERLVRFFREYADRIHHGKEEHLLFRAMEESGMSREAGPLAVMLHEHTEGRRLVGELAEAAAVGDVIAAANRAQVGSTIRAFGMLLAQHIEKEDRILYPMADQMLAEATWRSLEAAFEHFERQETDPEEVASLLGIAEDLEARYPKTGTS